MKRSEVEARVLPLVERLEELGVPTDKTEPIKRWMAEQWAEEVAQVLDIQSLPTTDRAGDR